MKVFHNGYEWWIARDMDHLRELYRAHTGLELEDDDAEGDGWYEWPDYKAIGVYPEDGGAVVRLSPAEWTQREGEGFLCSTEY